MPAFVVSRTSSSANLQSAASRTSSRKMSGPKVITRPVIVQGQGGPMGAAAMAMNQKPSYTESLYYKCVHMMRQLAKVPGMMPYIDLAYARAEENAERQAMALTASTADMPDFGESPTATTHNSLNASPHSSRSSGPFAGHWNSTLYTFSAGILPAQMAYDPVTPLWNLLQQGAPLCLIFNAINPDNAIDVVSSDDLKVCKLSVYQFLNACKNHLNVEDKQLFNITCVFSDKMSNFVKVIRSIEFIIQLDPQFDVPDIDDAVKVTDERSKVVREFIETERKYVLDLELLFRYENAVKAKGLISSENVDMLFPNLGEILDFQRRLLVGLECNGVVPPQSQRLGSVFVHAGIDGFKIYEAWSLYQNRAIEFMNREASNLRHSSDLIPSVYELQSFLIKPIQRLCKYPLLFRQLVKLTDQSWPFYQELTAAWAITREVAAQINETQRKSENMKLRDQLEERVVDWRGHSLAGIGDLLYMNTVLAKDLGSDGRSSEKEVECYLFERMIYMFLEHKKSSKPFSSRKKSSSSMGGPGSPGSAGTPLVLHGIVYVDKIYRVTTSDTSPFLSGSGSNSASTQGQGHFLTLRWRGAHDTGGCVMQFVSEEHMNQWDTALRQLASSSSSGSSSEDHVGGLISSTGSSDFRMAGHRSNSTLASDPYRNTASSGDVAAFMYQKARAQSTSSTFGPNGISQIPTNNTTIASSAVAGAPPNSALMRAMSTGEVRMADPSLQVPASALGTATPVATTPIAPTSGMNGYDEQQPRGFDGNAFNSSVNSNTEASVSKTRIRIIVQRSSASMHLTVDSEIDFDNLIAVFLNKIRYVLGDKQVAADISEDNVKWKFQDEDGDMIRFQSDADWEIAKDMLLETQDEESRVLTVMVCPKYQK